MSFGQATKDAMASSMRADPTVLVIGEDIRWGGSFGQFRGLYEEFGDRVIDAPISESLIVSMSVGAALTGMRPVASMSFVEFAMGAMDEIVNQAAKIHYMFGGQASIPMVLRCADGTISSAAAQHSESLEALFCHVPGLKVVAPSNAKDAKGLLIASIKDPNPVIFLENKRIQTGRMEVPEDHYVIPLGKAAVVRQGHDISVIAYSVMVSAALNVAERLDTERGISVEVIDLRTLVPLDMETVRASVAKTKRGVVAHEAWRFAGLGAEISSQLSESLFAVLEAPIARVGAKSSHIPFSPPLEAAVVPTHDDLYEAVSATVVFGR